eukprot:6173_1
MSSIEKGDSVCVVSPSQLPEYDRDTPFATAQQRARVLFQAHKFDEAFSALRCCLSHVSSETERPLCASGQPPPRARINTDMAVVKLAMDQCFLAKKYALSALELAPDYGEAHVQLASAYFGLGKTSKSIEHYKKSLKAKSPALAPSRFQAVKEVLSDRLSAIYPKKVNAKKSSSGTLSTAKLSCSLTELPPLDNKYESVEDDELRKPLLSPGTKSDLNEDIFWELEAGLHNPTTPDDDADCWSAPLHPGRDAWSPDYGEDDVVAPVWSQPESEWIAKRASMVARAQCLARDDDMSGAIGMFTEIITEAGHYVCADDYRNRAGTYNKMKKFDLAIDDMSQAMVLMSKDPQKSASDLLAARSDLFHMTRAKVWVAIENLARKWDWPAVAVQCTAELKVVDDFPGPIKRKKVAGYRRDYWLQRGRAYMKLEKYDLARTDFEASHNIEPTEESVIELVAVCLKLTDVKAAEKVLHRGKKKFPQSSRIQREVSVYKCFLETHKNFMLGLREETRNCINVQDYRKALVAADKMLEREKNSVDGLFFKSRVLYLMSNIAKAYPLAVSVEKMADQSDHLRLPIYQNLGLIHLKLEHYDSAVSFLEKAKNVYHLEDLEVSLTIARNRSATTSIFGNQVCFADELLEPPSVRDAKARQERMNTKADAAMAKREFVQAIDLYNKCFEINHQTGIFRVVPLMWFINRGYSYLHIGNYEQAIENAKHGLELYKTTASTTVANNKGFQGHRRRLDQLLTSATMQMPMIPPDRRQLPKGLTKLMSSVVTGNIHAVVVALNKMKKNKSRTNEIDRTCPEGYTALMYAAKHSEHEIARLLLNAGASPNVVNSDGDSTLLIAVQKFDTVMAELLLNPEYNCDLHTRNLLKWTPLSEAIRIKSYMIVKILLEAGADSTLQYENRQAPIVEALIQPQRELVHVNIAKLLLEHKASLNVKDRHGCTALSLALESGMDDVVTAFMVRSPASEQLALRERKASGEETYYVDLRGDESVLFARLRKLDPYVKESDFRLGEKWNGEKIKLHLKETAARRESHTKLFSVSELALAAERGEVKLVRWLLEGGVDVNEADRGGLGETALIRVVRKIRDEEEDSKLYNDLVKTIEVLSEYGADPSVKNDAVVSGDAYFYVHADASRIRKLLEKCAEQFKYFRIRREREERARRRNRKKRAKQKKISSENHDESIENHAESAENHINSTKNHSLSLKNHTDSAGKHVETAEPPAGTTENRDESTGNHAESPKIHVIKSTAAQSVESTADNVGSVAESTPGGAASPEISDGKDDRSESSLSVSELPNNDSDEEKEGSSIDLSSISVVSGVSDNISVVSAVSTKSSQGGIETASVSEEECKTDDGSIEEAGGAKATHSPVVSDPNSGFVSVRRRARRRRGKSQLAAVSPVIEVSNGVKSRGKESIIVQMPNDSPFPVNDQTFPPLPAVTVDEWHTVAVKRKASKASQQSHSAGNGFTANGCTQAQSFTRPHTAHKSTAHRQNGTPNHTRHNQKSGSKSMQSARSFGGRKKGGRNNPNHPVAANGVSQKKKNGFSFADAVHKPTTASKSLPTTPLRSSHSKTSRSTNNDSRSKPHVPVAHGPVKGWSAQWKSKKKISKQFPCATNMAVSKPGKQPVSHKSKSQSKPQSKNRKLKQGPQSKSIQLSPRSSTEALLDFVMNTGESLKSSLISGDEIVQLSSGKNAVKDDSSDAIKTDNSYAAKAKFSYAAKVNASNATKSKACPSKSIKTSGNSVIKTQSSCSAVAEVSDSQKPKKICSPKMSHSPSSSKSGTISANKAIDNKCPGSIHSSSGSPGPAKFYPVKSMPMKSEPPGFETVQAESEDSICVTNPEESISSGYASDPVELALTPTLTADNPAKPKSPIRHKLSVMSAEFIPGQVQCKTTPIPEFIPGSLHHMTTSGDNQSSLRPGPVFEPARPIDSNPDLQVLNGLQPQGPLMQPPQPMQPMMQFQPPQQSDQLHCQFNLPMQPPTMQSPLMQSHRMHSQNQSNHAMALPQNHLVHMNPVGQSQQHMLPVAPQMQAHHQQPQFFQSQPQSMQPQSMYQPPMQPQSMHQPPMQPQPMHQPIQPQHAMQPQLVRPQPIRLQQPQQQMMQPQQLVQPAMMEVPLQIQVPQMSPTQTPPLASPSWSPNNQTHFQAMTPASQHSMTPGSQHTVTPASQHSMTPGSPPFSSPSHEQHQRAFTQQTQPEISQNMMPQNGQQQLFQEHASRAKGHKLVIPEYLRDETIPKQLRNQVVSRQSHDTQINQLQSHVAAELSHNVQTTPEEAISPQIATQDYQTEQISPVADHQSRMTPDFTQQEISEMADIPTPQPSGTPSVCETPVSQLILYPECSEESPNRDARDTPHDESELISCPEFSEEMVVQALLPTVPPGIHIAEQPDPQLRLVSRSSNSSSAGSSKGRWLSRPLMKRPICTYEPLTNSDSYMPFVPIVCPKVTMRMSGAPASRAKSPEPVCGWCQQTGHDPAECWFSEDFYSETS